MAKLVEIGGILKKGLGQKVVQKFSQDNGINFNKNIDFFVTKIICKFLK